MASKQKKNDASGIVLLAKKSGSTSFSSLFDIKHALGTDKVGHTGTLDSFADGLLVILSGSLTHLVPHITGFSKTYQAVVCFGRETDTLDPTGEIIKTGPSVTRDAVEKVLPQFTGALLQVPPVYSAIHIGGKRASDLARKNKNNDAEEAIHIESREIFIYRNALIDFSDAESDGLSYALLEITCSKGTYIRSLARDIAHALGTCGHLSALRRTSVGPFQLSDAAGYDRLEPFTIARAKQSESLVGLPKQVTESPRERKSTPRDEKLFAEIRAKFTLMTPQLAAQCGFEPYELKAEYEKNYLNGRPLEHKMFMHIETEADSASVSETPPVYTAKNQFALFYKGGSFAGVYVREDAKYRYGFVVPPAKMRPDKRLAVYSWDDVVQRRFPIQLVKQGTALSVGSFDGVHAGHQALLDRVVAQQSLVPGVVTFRNGFKDSKEVSTLAQKLEICAQKGIMFAVVIDFSADFAKIEGTDFIHQLVQLCGMKYLSEGNDFRCGYEGACTIREIEQVAQQEHFVFECVDDVMVAGERVSSSRIRDAVMRSDFGLAQKMLLRPFSYDCSRLEWKRGEVVADQCWYSADPNFVQVLPPDGTFDVVAVMSGSEDNTPALDTYKTVCTLDSGNLRLLLPAEKTSVYIRTLNFIPVDSSYQR